MRLEPDRSCIKSLLWRYHLPEGVDLDAFIERLEGAGWVMKVNPAIPLVSLTHPEDHRLLIVRTTRRVQLRVHYTVEREDRERRARGFAQRFDNICESIGS